MYTRCIIVHVIKCTIIRGTRFLSIILFLKYGRKKCDGKFI